MVNAARPTRIRLTQHRSRSIPAYLDSRSPDYTSSVFQCAAPFNAVRFPSHTGLKAGRRTRTLHAVNFTPRSQHPVDCGIWDVVSKEAAGTPSASANFASPASNPVFRIGKSSVLAQCLTATRHNLDLRCRPAWIKQKPIRSTGKFSSPLKGVERTGFNSVHQLRLSRPAANGVNYASVPTGASLFLRIFLRSFFFFGGRPCARLAEATERACAIAALRLSRRVPFPLWASLSK